MIPELDRLVSLPVITGVGAWFSFRFHRERNLLICCRGYYPERLVDRFQGTAEAERGDPDLLHALAQIAHGIDTLAANAAYSEITGSAPTISSHNLLLDGRNAFVADLGLALKALHRRMSDEYGPRITKLTSLNLDMRGGQFDLASIYYSLRTGLTKAGYDKTGGFNLDALRAAHEREVVGKALAQNPAERFASCSEFIRRLVAVRNGQ